MVQVVEMTHEEKLQMYMKCSKKQLAEMLINCNYIIERLSDSNYVPYETNPDGTLTLKPGN